MTSKSAGDGVVVCVDSGTLVAVVDQNRYGGLNTTYYHATELNVR